MKNRKFRISLLAGVMAVVMLLGLVMSLLPVAVSAASSDEIRDQIDQLEQQKQGIRSEMQDLEARQNDNWETTEEMVAQKDNIDRQINLLNTEILNINEQVQNYSMLIAENQTRLDRAEEELCALNAEHRERIRAMEEEGTVSLWSVIFRASSFTELMDQLTLIEEIRRADQHRFDELSAASDEVEKYSTQLLEEKQILEDSRLELDRLQQELDEKRAEADRILTRLVEQHRELEAMYEQYQIRAEALIDQIAAAEKAYTEARQTEQGTPNPGGWCRPCVWTVLTCPYGWRTHPITGKQSFHTGVDLANVQGTPIYAARGGTVTTATYDDVYGYYVTINHGDGFSTLYGHMTNYVVSPGETVTGGQLIGYMGSTGWSTGPHLHFTIYFNGNTVNPMDYI